MGSFGVVEVTLVYRFWYLDGSVWYNTVRHVTEGVDGVRDIYLRSDGWTDVRHDDYDKDFMVPASQALALLPEEMV